MTTTNINKYSLDAFTFNEKEAVIEEQQDNICITFGMVKFVKKVGFFNPGEEAFAQYEVSTGNYIFFSDDECTYELLHYPAMALVWPELSVDNQWEFVSNERKRLRRTINTHVKYGIEVTPYEKVLEYYN